MKIKDLWRLRTKADYTFCMVFSGFAGAFLFMAIAFGPILIPFFFSNAQPPITKPHEPPYYWIVVLLAFLCFPIPMLITHFKLKPIMDRKKAILSAFMSDFTRIKKPYDLETALNGFMVFRTTDDNIPYEEVDAYDFIETTMDDVRVRIFTLDGNILESSFTSATGLSHRIHCCQKVLWIHSTRLNLSNFSIRSRRSLRSYPLPRNDLLEIDDNDFSKYYVLYGGDKDRIKRMCTDELIAECLRARTNDAFIFDHAEGSVYPELCIDGEGNDLLIFWQSKDFFEPEELKPFVELGLRLFSLLAGTNVEKNRKILPTNHFR